MELTNKTFAPLRVFIDELVRLGVRHAVAAPGSRNAPISYALADRDEISTWSVLDERSAGFFAAGIAQATCEPVVITCSSGSAVANLHPAVIEASHAGLPLILLTADRPPELRDVGAGQAIDQIKIFGSAVRWFVEAGNHPLSRETLCHFRALACRVFAEATARDPGPVHVNWPLREPLAPIAEDLADLELECDDEAVAGRADGRAWTVPLRGSDMQVDLDQLGLATAQRPLMIIGQQHTRGLAAEIAAFAAQRAIPLFADALSQMRRTDISDRAIVISAYDLILRNDSARSDMRPDFVLRIGETPTSKPLRSWLAGLACEQVLLDPRGLWHEPTRQATQVVCCDPLAAFRDANRSANNGNGEPAGAHSGVSAATPEAWQRAWQAVEIAARTAAVHALESESFPFEPDVYRRAIEALDSGATIFVSSSMPVRDIESFVHSCRDDVRFLANRGANGIDGVVSSALGAAAAYDCDRVVLITGDLALLHDVGALALIKQHDLDVTIVCVDNDGGGIFSFLPISEFSTHFEKRIATPSGVDIRAVVEAFGLNYIAPRDPRELADAVNRPGFVHLRTKRGENRAGHERVFAAAGEAVAAELTELRLTQ